jgi:hypothetical protein
LLFLPLISLSLTKKNFEIDRHNSSNCNRRNWFSETDSQMRPLLDKAHSLHSIATENELLPRVIWL